MGKQMSYTLMPTLEHRASVAIAVTLWNRDDVRDLTSEFSFSSPTHDDGERKREWHKVEDAVMKKVLKLPLPEKLKRVLSKFVGAVGWQILTWKEFHDDRCSFVIGLPNEIFWTPQGTIDKVRTAQALVKDENLDIYKRYKLACTYCLEFHIHALWKQLLEGPYRKNLRYIKMYETPLVSFWSHCVEGKIAELDNMMKRYCLDANVTPYEYAFRRSANSGNEAAARYFLQKLTSEEKYRSLLITAEYVASRRFNCVSGRSNFPKEHYSDVLCFLFSAMDKDQQIEIFKSCRLEVLECFLDWPWQSFFMEMANRMWTFLTDEEYDLILRIIVGKQIDGYKDCDYQKLFGEFWQQSPTSHKKYVISSCISGFLLSNLFEVEDKENITTILKNATSVEKEKLIFCDRGKNICASLILKENWDLLRLFIGECMSSKEKIIEFREEFKTFNKYIEKEDTWNNFFQLLDDFIEKDYKKRSMEESGSGPAKRLCSVEFEKVTHNIKK